MLCPGLCRIGGNMYQKGLLTECLSAEKEGGKGIVNFQSQRLPLGYSLRCFNKGCSKMAACVWRFEHEGLVFQFCLCADCAGMSPEVVIHGLIGPSVPLQGTRFNFA